VDNGLIRVPSGRLTVTLSGNVLTGIERDPDPYESFVE
jgi:hypothetical protein